MHTQTQARANTCFPRAPPQTNSPVEDDVTERARKIGKILRARRSRNGKLRFTPSARQSHALLLRLRRRPSLHQNYFPLFRVDLLCAISRPTRPGIIETKNGANYALVTVLTAGRAHGGGRGPRAGPGRPLPPARPAGHRRGM